MVLLLKDLNHSMSSSKQIHRSHCWICQFSSISFPFLFIYKTKAISLEKKVLNHCQNISQTHLPFILSFSEGLTFLMNSVRKVSLFSFHSFSSPPFSDLYWRWGSNRTWTSLEKQFINNRLGFTVFYLNLFLKRFC